MTSTGPQHIASRDNALLKDLRRLAQDNHAYRKQGRVWLEGDHLCRAALQRQRTPALAVFQSSYWAETSAQWPDTIGKVVVIDDPLFDSISSLESPGRMAFVLPLPEMAPVERGVPTVILDGLQDAGNVGSILRSAGAFGFRQVIALKGSAALWSPKVLRAGMGAHFGLRLVESADGAALEALQVPLVVTSSHLGRDLHRCRVPMPCAWVMGHEGQGVSPALAARAALAVRIPQPGGEESLNVAAAAAICLYASIAQP